MKGGVSAVTIILGAVLESLSPAISDAPLDFIDAHGNRDDL